MEMTEAEMARAYRLAKYKNKQVGIMADINGISREDVLCILIRSGETILPRRSRKSNQAEKGMEAEEGKREGRREERSMAPEGERISSVIIPSQSGCMEELFRKLDALDEMIARLEKEYRRTAEKLSEETMKNDKQNIQM